MRGLRHFAENYEIELSYARSGGPSVPTVVKFDLRCGMSGERSWFFGGFGIVGLRWLGIPKRPQRHHSRHIPSDQLLRPYLVGPTCHCTQVFTICHRASEKGDLRR